SFAQQRLWFLDQLVPANPFYNVPASYRLCGEVQVEALEAALGEIVARHEALRTTFVSREGRPVQVIAPPGAGVVRVPDLSHLDAAPAETEARRLATAE